MIPMGHPTAGKVRSREARRALDGRRVFRRTAIGVIGVFALLHLYLTVVGGHYAPDFHTGAWPAGWNVLHGQSPYLPADSNVLLRHPNSFVTPPVLAVLAAPYSLLPYAVAVALWNLSCAAALAGALWLLGVRDLRLYVLCLASVPAIDSFETGQADGILALTAAVAWRFRDSRAGPVALGGLIAAKLLALPLLVWLLATRRFRAAVLAIASSALFLVASWSLIGFKGLTEYPALLAADAKAFEVWDLSLSLPGALMHVGASANVATPLAIGFALLAGAAIVALGHRADRAWFAAALCFSLLASPILWWHYLVILFAPLAISSNRRPTVWLLPSWGLWAVFVVLHPAGLPRAMIAIVAALVLPLWGIRGNAHAQQNATDASQPTHPLPRELRYWRSPTGETAT